MMRFARACLLLVWSIPCVVAVAEDADTRTWESRWTNRKFNTSGPLKCVATETKNGEWEGTFTGTFMGDPFRYEATFQSKPGKGGQTDLGGKAVIRGHDYEWTGVIRGNRLSARYRSNVGYFGEFVLTEVTAKR